MTAEATEGQIRRRTQEVNEFIFQLEKYKNSQDMLSSETLATIDKYKLDKHKYELNDKLDSKLKRMQEANDYHAIQEQVNEFSVVTESQIDRQ